ncbi:carboxypeptidase regulatory-like domain-containing protein [Superficieibacter sp.]|uniref:carboxypeptidase regulatory-like domain-containing protein n=1 Tax=Superficieibacter sp. TaxID=2303322 RepID=UPI0028B0C208|nr:carboxypeptidase regulatory-like domain-containing protein [Superficieibacter sp.]
MNKKFWPALISAALLQSGCVTWYQSQPKVEGLMLNSQGQPLADQQVTLESNAGSETTQSDGAGRFTFSGKHELAFFIPIGPIDWIHQAKLQVPAAGQVNTFNLGGAFGNSHAFDGAQFAVVCQIPATTQLPPPEICHRELMENVTGNQPPK